MNTDNTEIAGLVTPGDYNAWNNAGRTIPEILSRINAMHKAIVRPLLDRIAELERALHQIVGIPNRLDGADWDEIEEARLIANKVLAFSKTQPTTCDPDPALQPAWTLPKPPPGREWSRKDGWTKKMLPPGYRPLLVGETGTYETSENGKTWQDGEDPDFPTPRLRYSFMRTIRPLPTEPEPLTLDQLAKRVAELETKLSKMEKSHD